MARQKNPFLKLPTKISVAGRDLTAFRRRALRRYPLEYIEVLIGAVREGGSIFICAFVPLPHIADETGLDYSHAEGFYKRVKLAAERNSLQVLGTIHTHPYQADGYDAAMSECDHDDGHNWGEIISGICMIEKKESGRRQTKIRFWLPQGDIPVKLR